MSDEFAFKKLGDPNPRTCRNCACVYHVEKPRIMPSTMTKEEWDKAPEMWVCRLDPPFIANTEKGPTLVQKPTAPNLVCWHWCAEGTLPGDGLRSRIEIQNKWGGGPGEGFGGGGGAGPPLPKCGAISPGGRGKHCELASGHGGAHLDEDKNAWLK